MENFCELYLLMLVGMSLYFPVYALIIHLGMGHPDSTINPAYKYGERDVY